MSCCESNRKRRDPGAGRGGISQGVQLAVGLDEGVLGDIGGPMIASPNESYRLNTPNVFYAYDRSFLLFFGTRGMQEVEKAIKILNDLPPASQLNVDDYPMTAERRSYLERYNTRVVIAPLPPLDLTAVTASARDPARR